MPNTIAIEAKELAVRRDETAVLRGLNFELQYGEFLALVGPNGAGKSTLLRGLTGLSPATGKLLIAGKKAASLTIKERAKTLAYVPQRPSIVPAFRTGELVAHGRFAHGASFGHLSAEDKQAVNESMTLASVSQFAHRPFLELSQGQQQRVMLARALCTGARILLLDEPAASLDIAQALRLYTLIRTLASRGYAILMAVHQLEHAMRFGSRVLLLHQDGSMNSGPPEEVLSPDRVRGVFGVDMYPKAGIEFHLANASQVVP